jgi:hypothetical protein
MSDTPDTTVGRLAVRRRPASRRAAAVLALAALAALAGGCASASGSPPPAAPPAALAQLSPATSLTSASGTWTTIPMGGTGPNLFWQLFARPAAGGRWSLQTPPAIATNGALILAVPGGTGQDAKTLAVGVRPSLDLSFSPMMTTADGGRDWATTPPDPGLANVPDSLAAAPGGQLLALDINQQVSDTVSATAAWTALTSSKDLAATDAGRRCAPAALTAVAYTATGTPLLGAACAMAGTVGIFAYSAGTWRLAGPALPASLAGGRVQVLRLTRTAGTDTALLEVGTGQAATLVAAWTSDDAVHWTTSAAFRLGGAQPVSASTGGGGAIGVILSGGRGELLNGPLASWRPLPALPPGRSLTLALPAAGSTDALAANGTKLTVWQLAEGSASWSKAQVINVPIQYGSSS